MEHASTTDGPAVANKAETGGRAGATGRAQPERRCLATRRSRPKAELIRFVIAQDGTLTPDLDAKLPGRGYYVSPDAAALNKAVAKGLFARAAKRPILADAGLPDLVERLLARRCVDLLSLARRAGAAVCGNRKVRGLVDKSGPLLIFSARDGAADGRDKLAALARATGARVTGALTRSEIAQAFGRDDAVHAAVEMKAGFADLRRFADWLDGMRNQAENPNAAARTGAPPHQTTPDKA